MDRIPLAAFYSTPLAASLVVHVGMGAHGRRPGLAGVAALGSRSFPARSASHVAPRGRSEPALGANFGNRRNSRCAPHLVLDCPSSVPAGNFGGPLGLAWIAL